MNQQLYDTWLGHSLPRSVNELKNFVRFSDAFGHLERVTPLTDEYELLAYRMLAHGMISTLYHMECQTFRDFEDTALADALAPILRGECYNYSDVVKVHDAAVQQLSEWRGVGPASTAKAYVLKEAGSNKYFNGVSSRHHDRRSGSLFLCENPLQAATYIVQDNLRGSAMETIHTVVSEVERRFGIHLTCETFPYTGSKEGEAPGDFLWVYEPEEVEVIHLNDDGSTEEGKTLLYFISPWPQIVRQVRRGLFGDWSWPPIGSIARAQQNSGKHTTE